MGDHTILPVHDLPWKRFQKVEDVPAGAHLIRKIRLSATRSDSDLVDEIEVTVAWTDNPRIEHGAMYAKVFRLRGQSSVYNLSTILGTHEFFYILRI